MLHAEAVGDVGMAHRVSERAELGRYDRARMEFLLDKATAAIIVINVVLVARCRAVRMSHSGVGYLQSTMFDQLPNFINQIVGFQRLIFQEHREVAVDVIGKLHRCLIFVLKIFVKCLDDVKKIFSNTLSIMVNVAIEPKYIVMAYCEQISVFMR